MKSANKTLAQRLIDAFSSNKFFVFIVGLLVFQASWIALSGRYPMAFDEDFHVGIINLYAHHISPFWTSQPSGADTYGAVARDPSFLYHYLMSFPYRLISLMTDNLAAKVVVLRFINIALFAYGLVLFRRLLATTRANKGLVHLCLLILILLPITPLLAAQINYDNLFMPLTAGTLLVAIALSRRLAKKDIDARLLLGLVIICLATSLVKYAFLPILVAVLGFVIVRLIQCFGSLTTVLHSFVKSFKKLSGFAASGLLVAVVILSIVFAQRYGVNLVKYHTPVPDCGKVLTVQQCSQYGPWIRDYNLKLNKVAESHNPAEFTHEWFYGMWLRTFFAVDGPATGFETRGPLLVPGVGAIVLASISAVAVVIALPKIFRRYDRVVLSLFVAAIVVFIVTLWLDEFEAFVRTGQPVAINGRYLLPVMPLILFFGAAAWNEILKHWQGFKITFAAISILVLVCGGGFLTYVLRSGDAWYWDSSVTRAANHAIQDTLGPITPGYEERTQFLH